MCAFETVYIGVVGSRQPSWSEHGWASGDGVSCDARIIDINSKTHAWTVEFVIGHGQR